MKFEEFENTLQDWLDEGRLDEVETLLPLVCEADQAACEELLLTYQALFAGLKSASPVGASLTMASTSVASRGNAWKVLSLPAIAMGMALCLTIVATAPGLFSPSQPDVSPAPQSLVTIEPIDIQSAPLPSLTPEAQIASRSPDFTRIATASFEPLARSMANRTDMAFKSINRVAIDLNPIDEQLSAYQEAAPLIDTLTRGFLPGTRSLSNAFSVLHETAIEPSAPTQEQESIPLSPASAEQNPVVS